MFGRKRFRPRVAAERNFGKALLRRQLLLREGESGERKGANIFEFTTPNHRGRDRTRFVPIPRRPC